MKCLVSALAYFVKEEAGQDLVEYALVMAVIALGSVAAIKSLSDAIGDVFQKVGSALTLSVS